MYQNPAKIFVKVQPNSGRNGIAGFSSGVWRIKIAAQPEKGKANKELIEYLSIVLDIQKADLEILKGPNSHHKIISVKGLTPEVISSRLSTLISRF
jgi:uncharacterized protein (TIGR00251 family)